MMMFAVLADAGSRKGPMVISGDQCSSMCSAMLSMPKLSQTSRISVAVEWFQKSQTSAR